MNAVKAQLRADEQYRAESPDKLEALMVEVRAAATRIRNLTRELEAAIDEDRQHQKP